MGRKKLSLAEDLLNLVALLPWWAGVGLSIASYFLLHRLAIPDVPVAIQPGQMGGMAVRAMTTALAGVGQYVLPLICLGGAATSAWRRHQRKSLAVNVAEANGADALDGMSWREFEMLVGEAFRMQGFSVGELGGAGPDGGVDLVLKKGTEKFLVQCKQWKAYKVGVDVVRELYGVMAAKGAAGGFVVTSGSFTADAKGFAEGRNVKLVDGQRLSQMIKEARATLSAGSSAGAEVRQASETATQAHIPADVVCPACGAGMVQRTAKRGSNAGAMFWGCSTYPACRGTRQIS
ncbi:restriction endonuclease [Pelomonas sp. SE-A7]|uniref:restriction endonuclease n=1 Tax=Pelomonas sp. SE-A7 TaxID=3054953 RepID=UPI00259C7177|nr:restriction endonuclease [Pelomonas sp. SE-A7]MDM4766152.1 restriction endonuclease [Pelomonas sp. SE-A7]